MRSSHLLRLKVGIILNFLLLGCMVLFLTLSPLLISGITGYLDSGDSLFFPQLMSKIYFLPLTLGQFLDQCIILSLLWIVLSSFFPLVRKIRERLKLFPGQMYLSNGNESVIIPHSWILSDISRWDKFGTNSLNRQKLLLDFKNERDFTPRILAEEGEKYSQFNQTQHGGNSNLFYLSWALLVNRNTSIFVLLFIRSCQLSWILFDHSFLNFKFTQICLCFGVNSDLILCDYQNSVKIWTLAIRIEIPKSTGGGVGG